ncbi:556_t:CDS:2 [Diversispora eburnea]|uniref:556_t:CDS:1 n=1 Tax=Diversispora eburnea TaxID=1213867 RepID=A0A9N8ZYH2_9GLOM|nr:556_t:CDS:2 [Diversispora eburnea]
MTTECLVKFSYLEKAIDLWISQVSASGLTISDNILYKKARIFVQALDISEKLLSLSNKLLSSYEVENIYNANKTELFYRMTSNQTLVTEVIDFIEEVWEKVTSLTITNCWIETGILSDTNEEEINDAKNNMQDKDLYNQNEIDNLLLDIDISLEFEDNNNIAIEELLTDDQIIKLILKENNSVLQNINNESDNEEPPIVSIKESFVSLKKWISFFEQQNSNDFCFDDLIKFKKYI